MIKENTEEQFEKWQLVTHDDLQQQQHGW